MIEKVLNVINDSYYIILSNEIIKNFLVLACDCRGIVLVKQLIKYDKVTTWKYVNQLVYRHTLDLMYSQYGNYLIQEALEVMFRKLDMVLKRHHADIRNF